MLWQMKKWIERKEFEKEFAPLNKSGTQIWVITRVKKLPIEIVNMAIRLANLDFINFVRICDETLSASSENYSEIFAKIRLSTTKGCGFNPDFCFAPQIFLLLPTWPFGQSPSNT